MRKYLGLSVFLLISACGSQSGSDSKSSEEGREETRVIRNTESMGYAGDAMADNMDKALNANDQRREQLESME